MASNRVSKLKGGVSFLVMLLLLSLHTSAQAINFNDPELKRFLISENCVDTAYNGNWFTNHISVDLNADNEIQLSEALRVQYLELIDFSDIYSIKSLLDLNSFSNLKYLKVISIDSLVDISKLSLDSLCTLWISDGASLRKIDISNLPGITSSLKIEGITTLDTLNIRNGTVAKQFSLFYTQHTKFACVDSIADEYDAFAIYGAMEAGTSPSLNCEQIDLNHYPTVDGELKIYPIPAAELITIESQKEIISLEIYNTLGQIVAQPKSHKIVDVSELETGVYYLSVQYSGRVVVKKIAINKSHH